LSPANNEWRVGTLEEKSRYGIAPHLLRTGSDEAPSPGRILRRRRCRMDPLALALVEGAVNEAGYLPQYRRTWTNMDGLGWIIMAHRQIFRQSESSGTPGWALWSGLDLIAVWWGYFHWVKPQCAPVAAADADGSGRSRSGSLPLVDVDRPRSAPGLAASPVLGKILSGVSLQIPRIPPALSFLEPYKPRVLNRNRIQVCR